MEIFTYYHNVPELNLEDETRLLLAWRRNWKAAGFEPVVLNEMHARRHSHFEKYDQAISALPSTNPTSYEKACWLRWVALARVGGGWMCDYDVFVYPDDDQPGVGMAAMFNAAPKEPRFEMLQERAPSLCFANQVALNLLISEFGSGKWGSSPQGDRQHWSDQYAFEQMAATPDFPWLKRRDQVKAFGDKGWETALFVHYANDPMTRAGKIPKWRHVNTVR